MLDVPPLPMQSNIFEVDPDNIATDLRVTKTEDIVHQGTFPQTILCRRTHTILRFQIFRTAPFMLGTTASQTASEEESQMSWRNASPVPPHWPRITFHLESQLALIKRRWLSKARLSAKSSWATHKTQLIMAAHWRVSGIPTQLSSSRFMEPLWDLCFLKMVSKASKL